MYEVVMGIPKSEGMRPPPKIPANPSFVELDEDENAVEKFKEAMGNISSILSLDRLKQVWYKHRYYRYSRLRNLESYHTKQSETYHPICCYYSCRRWH